MQNLCFDCIGLIAKYLAIEDLVNLSKTCKNYCLALKSKKLSYVWHNKYWSWYCRNFLQKRKKVRENDIIISLRKYEIKILCKCFDEPKESTDDRCKCLRY